MTRVTLSIVSHGHGALVQALLHDLSRQSLARGMEIVLTLNIPEPLPDTFGLHVIVRQNDAPKGFGANHNAALAEAVTPWVFVVNPDIRIRDERLVEAIVGDDVKGDTLLAPVIRNSLGEREDSVRYNLDPLSLIGRAILRRRQVASAVGHDEKFRWVAGMFMALPLTTWRRLGGFDERFFLYCEDYDLCARLVLMGGRVAIDESLEATHDAQRSSRSSFKYLRWHVESLTRVWRSGYFWKFWARDIAAAIRR